MGTLKRKRSLDEDLDFHGEGLHMAAPGFSTAEDAMTHRNSAIFVILQQSENMGMDAMVGYRALQIYDRYASRDTVQAADLERIAISCFTISLRTMDRQDFSRMLMSNRNLITEEIQRTEDRIVRICGNWDMRGPNSFTFLDYFVDYIFPDQGFRIPLQEIQRLILKFQKDKKSTRFKPSVITAAAILKMTSKLGTEGILVHGCCKQQFFGEEGLMKGNEGDILNCESAMEKWYLKMVERGEISLEDWICDLYGSIEEGDDSGDDSSPQVKPDTDDKHDENQGGPSTSDDIPMPLLLTPPSSPSSSSSSSSSSADKGNEGVLALDEWDSKMLEDGVVLGDDSSSQVEIQTSEIREECQAGPSSTDKGKESEVLDGGDSKMLEEGEQVLGDDSSSQFEIQTSEIHEECQAGPLSTDKGKESEVLDGQDTKMLEEGEEVTGDDSSSPVKPHTSEIQPHTGPSSTDKGKGKASDKELSHSSLLEMLEDDSSSPIQPHTSEIQPYTSEIQPCTSEIQPYISEIQPCTSEIQPHTGPSSTDKGQGKASDEEQTQIMLWNMMERGELSLPSLMEILYPDMPTPSTSTNKGKGEAGPSTSANKQMPSSSTTNKGKGKEVVDKWEPSGFEICERKGVVIREQQEDEIREERQAGPSSTDKGKGKEVVDNREGREVETEEERHRVRVREKRQAGPSYTEGIREDHFRFILKMMKEGEVSTDMAIQILTAVKQSPATSTDNKDNESTERTRYRLLGFELNWNDDEIPEDSEEEDETKGRNGWNKVKKWMAKNKKRLKKKLKDLKEKME